MSDFPVLYYLITFCSRRLRAIILLLPAVVFFVIDAYAQTFNYDLLLRKDNYTINKIWRSKDGKIYYDNNYYFVHSVNKGLTWTSRRLPVDFWVSYGIAGRSSLVLLNDMYNRRLFITPDDGITFRPAVKTFSYPNQIEIDKINRIFIADTSSEGRLLISTDLGVSFDSIFTGSKIIGVGAIDTNIYISLSQKGIYKFDSHSGNLLQIYSDTALNLKFAKGEHSVLYAYDEGGTIIRFIQGLGWKRFFSSKTLKDFYVDSLDHWFDFSSSLFQSLDSGATWIYRGGADQYSAFVLDNQVYANVSLGIVRAGLSAEPPKKHFFPMAKGNKYQYKKTDIIFNHNQNPTYTYSLVTYEIDRDTLINGKWYYPFLFWPALLSRQDTAARKIYLRVGGGDEILCDYGLGFGTVYQNFDPIYSLGSTINYYSLSEFDGKVKELLFFGRFTGTPGLTQISEFEAIDSIGIIRRYTATGGRFSGTGQKYELLSALIKHDHNIAFSNGKKPVFSVTPVTKTAGPSLIMNVIVNHDNNVGTIQYISSVKCYYYYTSQTGKSFSGQIAEDSIKLTPAGYNSYRLTLPLNMEVLRAGGKLLYRLAAYDKALAPNVAASPVSGYYTLMYDPSLDAEETDPDREFTLFPCFPNPFSGSTKISFYLPEAVNASFELYSPLGSKILEFGKSYYNEGMNQLELNTHNLSSGVYVLKLIAGKNSAYQKVVAVK